MIKVTCAVIRNDENRVLIVQRGQGTDHPFKWEFPGGKICEGETPEECIIREIEEELSIEIVICDELPEVEHDYGHKKILLIPFICDTLDEIPLLSEHLAFKWLAAQDLVSVDFCEADIFVARSYLEKISTEDHPEIQQVPQNIQDAIDDAELQSLVNNMMSMKEAEWVATSAIENPAIFRKLFEYSKSADSKLAFRASWTLTKVCDKFPEIIYPFLSQIVDLLDSIDNESALRSFLRILSLSDPEKIDKHRHGILADFCFNMLKSGFSAIAIKAYSMEILYRLALIYPELANELSACITMLQGDGSAGIKSRGHIIMKKLAEIPLKQNPGEQVV